MSTRTDEIMVASALKGQIIYPYTAADGNTFTFTIDDRFNTVKFGNDVPNLTLVKELDLDGDDENDLLSIKDLSFIFTGTTTLKAAKANGFAIDKLTVNSGANLRITTGNELVVNDLANSGIITIGGYIYYKNTCVKGTVYSQGGAIKAYDSTSSVSYAQDLVNDAINEAIANGESTVTLDRNIELSEALVFQPTAISRTSESAPLEITLDLNGKTVKNDYGTVIKVSEGVKLTITGNGTVLGATTNQCGSQAVCADGGEVIIENGTFKVGGDLSYPANPRNDCIYITSNGGSITIEGGYFEYTGARVKENYQNDGRFFLLNDKDSAYASGDATMIVKAGTFVDFNPAANYAENGEGTTNFLDENSKVTEVKNANGIDETATYANEPYGKTWTLSRTYKVEVVED